MTVKGFLRNGLAALIRERPREIIVTTESLSEVGKRKHARILGAVWGHGTPIVNGDDADNSIAAAHAALVQRAQEKRANVVTDLRMDAQSLPQGTVYVAYGTAVQMEHMDEWD